MKHPAPLWPLPPGSLTSVSQRTYLGPAPIVRPNQPFPCNFVRGQWFYKSLLGSECTSVMPYDIATSDRSNPP